MRRGTPLLLDGVAAVALVAFLVGATLVARPVQAAARPPDALGLALLVLCGAALAVRRARPVVAYLVAVGAAVAYLGSGFAGWPVYVGAVAGLVALVDGVAAARLWVPLAAVGMLGVAITTGRVELWRVTPMLSVAAIWVLVAVLGQRLAASRRRHAEDDARRRVSEERLRIARELHDVLSHSLASISLQAGVGMHLASDRPDQAEIALGRIREISSEALAKARSALSVVRDPSDASDPRTNAGLAELEAMVTSLRENGLSVDLTVDLPDRVAIPADVGGTAYLVVREALVNTLRHAGPGARAWASLRQGADSLEIDVSDDGRAPATVVPGHGLRGMDERVRAVGGLLRPGRAAGGGFSVQASLPLGTAR